MMIGNFFIFQPGKNNNILELPNCVAKHSTVIYQTTSFDYEEASEGFWFSNMINE
jgi:hypothetical protein